MFVPSGNLNPKKYSPPKAEAILSSSSWVKVSRFIFKLKFCGVVFMFRASCACEIFLYASAILIFCEIVIVLHLYQNKFIIKQI